MTQAGSEPRSPLCLESAQREKGDLPPFRTRSLLHAASIALSALLAGSGNAAPPPMPDKSALAQACAGLQGKTIAPGAIGLASGAATVTTAKLVAAVTAAPGFAEYCQVLGAIAPLSAGADPIRFQINLPTTWNGKAVMIGGGGFNGTLTNAAAALRDAAPGQPQPITQGFATFGTDSGHDASGYLNTDPAKFALNDEMFLNFAHQAYKKVRDVAHEVMLAYYRRKPTRQYFYGGSEGGREGLTMAQRYPEDFDGIVSVVPVISWTGLFNGFINYTLPQLRIPS